MSEHPLAWSMRVYGFALRDKAGTPLHPLYAIASGAWPLPDCAPMDAAAKIVNQQGLNVLSSWKRKILASYNRLQ